jgi:hypothetical protein
MAFTDCRGWEWGVARLADVPFPTSVGGNTRDCPLDDVCKGAHVARGARVTGDEVRAELRTRLPEVKRCWHHRLDKAELFYVAELSCWFVEQEIHPHADSVAVVVRRDGRSIDVQHAVEELFDYPLSWSFVPGEPLRNGRHRLCAFKARGVPRVAMRLTMPT